MRAGSPKSKRSQGGFTLIELLVVCAIIGLLSAVAVANYRRSIVKAKEAVLHQDLYTMRTLINQYFADKGKYPSDIHALVDDHYLQAIPKDPFTNSAETWVTEQAQLDESDITTEPGIIDVKSGAEGTALDGSNYSEF